MLRLLQQLFQRYSAHHARLDLAPQDLASETGAVLGRLDRVRVRRGRLEVEGWTTASRVSLRLGDETATTTPDLSRTDVAAALELDTSSLGFWIDAPWHLGPAHLVLEADTGRYVYALPMVRRRRWRAAQMRCLPGFVGAVAGSVPDGLRWRASGDLAARARVKRRLGLDDGPRGLAEVDPALLGLPRETGAASLSPAPLPPAPADTRVTIVLPVYNAFDLLPEVLERVVTNTDLDWHLVAVEDGSPDDRVRPFLRDWVAGQPEGRVTLLENDGNLGFIRSVNRAFEVAVARGDHVLLLNSDAFLPAGWGARLLAPILDDATVASVTPMSNDAEIFTVPAICVRSDLAPGEADALDAAAATLDARAALAEAPTGVGFAMAMNIDHLAANPVFDTAFGRGYGEEVDWCQKARAAGARHLGHGGVFVEHRGGQSFGPEKLKLVAANNAVISQRYRGYDAEVQRFIAADPLAGPRLALALAWAGRAGAQVPVYLAHDMGGGATSWLNRRIEEHLDEIGAAVVLRVGGRVRWQIELHAPEGVTRGATSDTDTARALLGLLPRRRMIYSCGVGDGDAVEIPALLHDLAQGDDNAAEVLVHDFYPVSPSYTLLDAEGRYRGVPAPGTEDAAHRFRRPDGAWIDLADWRAAWDPLMREAEAIRVFSGSSRDIVQSAYPAVSGSIELRPHMLLHAVPRIPPGGGWKGRPVIGVLGNIGYQKGAAVLRDLSRQLADSGAARLVVVGNIDPAYALAPPAIVHGDYRLDDLPGLVRRYGIDGWLIPSIWPETFSYATHEAIATGLPVWAFDLGGQGEAVAASVAAGGPGAVLPLVDGTPDLDRLMETMLQGLDTREALET